MSVQVEKMIGSSPEEYGFADLGAHEHPRTDPLGDDLGNEASGGHTRRIEVFRRLCRNFDDARPGTKRGIVGFFVEVGDALPLPGPFLVADGRQRHAQTQQPAQVRYRSGDIRALQAAGYTVDECGRDPLVSGRVCREFRFEDFSDLFTFHGSYLRPAALTTAR